MTDFCIFCAIAAGSASAFMVYDDDDAVAFLDLAPLRPGHTLVIPRRHVADVMADGGAQAIRDVAPALHEVSRLLVKAFEADGVNVLQSNGAAAGQEVFHLHLHVVPRHAGDQSPLRWVRDADAAAHLADTHALVTAARG